MRARLTLPGAGADANERLARCIYADASSDPRERAMTEQTEPRKDTETQEARGAPSHPTREERSVNGEDLLATIRELIDDGNVRRNLVNGGLGLEWQTF